jgi:hypothetical protein
VEWIIQSGLDRILFLDWIKHVFVSK